MKLLKPLSTAILSLLIGGMMHAQCNASATVTPTSTPGEVSIVDNSTSSSGGTYSYIDFYNASNWNHLGTVWLQPNSTIATFQFPANGTYYYYLAVEDSLSGCYDSIGSAITITGMSSTCDASFSYTVDSNGTATFSPNAASSAYSYYWDFGNGMTSNSMTATTSYNTSGSYTVCLTVWDSSCSDTVCMPVNITIGGGSSANCDASFTSIDSSGYVYFSPNVYSSNYYYMWDFGDGTYGYNGYEMHTYASGTYTACLTVIDSTAGCSDYYCQTFTVGGSGNPCGASFILLQDSVNAGLYYAWNNSVGSNLSYFWDFGDGNTSNQAYPTHVYASIGIYQICLTVTDNSSCTSTFCDTINVVVKANGTTLNVLAPGQSVGVEEQQMIASSKLYPNPTNGNFTLEVEAVSSGDVTINVMNIAGQIVSSLTTHVYQGSNQIRFEESHLVSGIYLVNVINELSGETTILKLIKE